MLTRRLQVLLDESRYERLREQAVRRGVSVGSLVREGIDCVIPVTLESKRAAWEALKAMPPMPVPDDPADIRKELDEAHDRFSP